MLRSFMVVVFTFVLPTRAGAEDPFWKTKAKLYDRVKNGEVIVSVTAHDMSPAQPKWNLVLAGGGHVRAPCAVVFREAEKFEEAAKLTGYFENPKYDPATGKMQATISAYGFRRLVNMAVTANDGREVEMRMLDGPMRGFWWRLSLSEIKSSVCEVALTGDYGYDEFPIPRLFLQFGMEVIFKRTAERLGKHVREVFAKTPGQGAA